MKVIYAAALLVIFSGTAFAQAPMPANTVDCTQFKKVSPTEWDEVGTATFDVGGVKHMQLTGSPVSPRAFSVGGIDLFELLERKCGN